jgi:hypothetical protein
MNPARFRWGILFILVGVILLLNNIGELEWWVWADIASLWPLILIAIGLEKIFTKSRAEIIAYLPVLALSAAVLWVAFEGFDDGDSYQTRRGSSYRYSIDMESEVERIKATFNLDDIDISLKNTGHRLFRARSDGWRRVPKVEFDEIGGVAELELSSKRSRLPNWIRIDRWNRSGDWDLYLSDQVPIKLDCYGDESDMTLDCRGLLLEELYVESEQGDIRIKLGSLNELVKVKLEGPEADFRVSLPEGCGVKISGTVKGMDRLSKRVGLIESGEYFMSEGYDTLTTKIELDLSSELSQFALDYY